MAAGTATVNAARTPGQGRATVGAGRTARPADSMARPGSIALVQGRWQADSPAAHPTDWED
jgi:hypothetical protein